MVPNPRSRLSLSSDRLIATTDPLDVGPEKVFVSSLGRSRRGSKETPGILTSAMPALRTMPPLEGTLAGVTPSRVTLRYRLSPDATGKRYDF